MSRLTASFGGLLGVLLVPLGLAAPTAWLMLPAHLAFAALTAAVALAEGLAGRGERARLWGFGYLVATLLAVGALELGARVDGAGWWAWPWALLLAWAWIPPVIAGAGGWIGDRRSRGIRRRVLRRRRRAAAVEDQRSKSPG